MIRAVIDGRTYTATENYHSMSHSGAASEVYEFAPPFARQAFEKAGLDPQSVEGGEVTVVVDGTLVSRGVNKFPETTTGSADQSGFGFGGLDAKLDIMNYGHTANRSFSVRKSGETDWGTDRWVTTVDDETVETGEMRPFQITWENGGSGGLGL